MRHNQRLTDYLPKEEDKRICVLNNLTAKYGEHVIRVNVGSYEVHIFKSSFGDGTSDSLEISKDINELFNQHTKELFNNQQFWKTHGSGSSTLTFWRKKDQLILKPKSIHLGSVRLK